MTMANPSRLPATAYTPKSSDKLFSQIIRADPASNHPEKVAIVPLTETGYYPTIEGHIQSLRRLLACAAGACLMNIVNMIVQTCLEELVDDSGARPFSIGFGYRGLHRRHEGEMSAEGGGVVGQRECRRAAFWGGCAGG
jgi:hypothetical protein